MATQAIGYEFLAEILQTGAFQVQRPAKVGPVTRITEQSGALLVPASVAPRADPLQHLLFAFKHEGMNLRASILALN